MKTRLLTVFVIAGVVTSLLPAGCTATPEHASIEVSCDDFYTNPHITAEVHIPVDGTVTLIVCSNPTTGFEWEQKVFCPLLGSILTKVDHSFIGPEETGEVGVPGQEVWTFKGVGRGTSTISLDYSQPWEGGEKGLWTYTLTIVVE